MSGHEAEAILGAGVSIQEKLDGVNLGVQIGSDVSITKKKPWLPIPQGGVEAVYRFANQHFRPSPKLHREQVVYLECLDPALLRVPMEHPWFVIDVLDLRLGRFLASEPAAELAASVGLMSPPSFGHRRLRTIGDLAALVRSSHVVEGPMEGVILRSEANGVTLERYKFVRPGHTQVDGGPS